jgi:hypothetical protein
MKSAVYGAINEYFEEDLNNLLGKRRSFSTA